jgi:hypothetical protein
MLGMFQERFPGRRQSRRPTTLEETLSQFQLQSTDLLTYRRLGQMKELGRPPKTSRPRHRLQSRELIQGHKRSRFLKVSGLLISGALSVSKTVLSRRRRRAHRGRISGYLAFLLLLVVFIFFLRTPTNLGFQERIDWRIPLAGAEASRQAGNVHESRHLYMKAGRFAAWRNDWVGLLAAACDMSRIESEIGPYSATVKFLLQAMVAAEKEKSTPV